MPLFGPPNIKKMEARQDVKGLIKLLFKIDEKRDLGVYRRKNFVRLDATEALVRIGAPAVEALMVALQGEKAIRWTVDFNLGRCAAAKALGEIGDARAVEVLIATFGEKWRFFHDPETHGAYHSLEVMNDMVRGLKRDGEYLPSVAGEALVKIGTVAIRPLMSELEESSLPNYDELIEALAGFGQDAINAIRKNPRVSSHTKESLEFKVRQRSQGAKRK